MKKLLATLVAGVMSVSALSCLAACGGGREPETADREAPAYEDGEWQAQIDLNTLQSGDFGEISADLFGLFLEDINYASFALDDNEIVNGSFETLSDATDGRKEYGWTENKATITVKADASGALHPNNTNYAEVSTPAGGTLSNSGHREVPVEVKNGVDYTFSMFIKGYAGDVTVSVKDDSTTYAEGSFTVAESDEWTKYIKTIKATGTASEKLSVELSFGAADTSFCIDSVKFETTEATDFGMRNYMYKAIEDLAPKFFRFPGGCVIEGTTLDEAYDWKNSIGVTETAAKEDVMEAFTYPVNDNGQTSTATTYGEQATRKQNVNIWQGNKTSNDYYNHEYGIGFYEYFCLCDALGAKAIPIVNCGYSCQTQGTGTPLAGRHENKVKDYIQDAIDLIEFAKGATSTKWGKVREQMGHPEPFEMDYIGVGNEQWGDYYQQYYEKFLADENFQAALQQYNVRPIVGNCTLFEHCENPNSTTKTEGAAQAFAKTAKLKGVVDTVAEYGVVDQHYYVNYTDFFLNTTLYDNYARPDDKPEEYYDVFVGEYAANANEIRSPKANNDISYNQTNGSWITALSEAAMMTGFERNGDIVKLAAYAPMFGVANQSTGAKTADKATNQWAVDMMYFTNTSVVLTPNYYVQQLFMHNAGTQKVNSTLTFADDVMPTTTVKQSNGNGTRTYDNFYYVTSYNKETKNLIVKIVNAGEEEMKFNLNVKIGGMSLTGIAQVTELANEDKNATSTFQKGDAIVPKREKIGFENGSFGYVVPGYSVVAFQIRVI